MCVWLMGCWTWQEGAGIFHVSQVSYSYLYWVYLLDIAHEWKRSSLSSGRLHPHDIISSKSFHLQIVTLRTVFHFSSGDTFFFFLKQKNTKEEVRFISELLSGMKTFWDLLSAGINCRVAPEHSWWSWLTTVQISLLGSQLPPQVLLTPAPDMTSHCPNDPRHL